MSLHKEISFKNEICVHLTASGWLYADGDAVAYDRALAFPGGALVHFAVSNSEVAMATQHAGQSTQFLSFNLGNRGAAGNPTGMTGGAGDHRTTYLWQQVWQRDSWLEVLGRYLIAQRNAKKQLERIIFPRYHQLDVTRKLQAAVLKDRPGSKYRIQHSRLYETLRERSVA